MDIRNLSINSFWQANFWGILGTTTGLAGLIVSWFSFRYHTPKIVVEDTSLIIPGWLKKDLKYKTVDDVKNFVLEFDLEIVVSNTRGGSGSIDKPILLIRISDGRKYKFLKIKPITEHVEMKWESSNSYNSWIERHGRSFNLSGGEKLDDKLTYRSSKPELIHDYIQQYENAKYYIEYRDNLGKKQMKKVKNVIVSE